MKLLSRVILQINGAIDAMNKEERVTFFPQREGTPAPCVWYAFSVKLKLKDERDELVDYSPRNIAGKSKQTEALEVVAEANPSRPMTVTQ